jgi:glycosyltransferase involved in cell wall biosynthesis
MMPGRPDIALHLYEPGDGGLDRVAILLANGFAARGLASEIWLTRNEGPTRPLISDAVKVRTLPALHTSRGLALALQIPALRRLVSSVRPKLLLSAGNQSNLSVAMACLGTECAAIGKITNPVDRPQSKGLSLALRKRRFAWEAQLARLTLTLSSADAERYGHWFGSATLAPVRNPYVSPQMIAVGQARAPSSGVPQLLSIGRLNEQKDHATLLSALGKMTERPWHLTIAGDGPLRGALEEQAHRLGIADRVTFAGFVEALPHYARSDCLILSSRWEGLPAVALEALACGCDLVTTDCSPGLSGIVQGLGLTPTVPVADPEGLRNAIIAAMDRKQDRAALVQAGADYDIDHAVDDHLRLLAPFLS